MKERSALLIGLAVFAALFALRFVQLFWFPSEPRYGGGFVGSYEKAAAAPSKANYASDRLAVPQGDSGSQVVEQKYERVSDVDLSTAAWDADSAAVYAVVEESSSIVQREDKSGLPGERVLELELGTVPDRFDAAVEAFKKIGNLESWLVTKRDRTADFMALEARRLSLEKTRDGLAGLRSAGADLKDRIDLESRILEIEGQIQELGVQLGDYRAENSFCTIRLVLREKPAAALAPRILRAALDAFGWACAVSAGLAVALLALLGAARLLTALLAKLKA